MLMHIQSHSQARKQGKGRWGGLPDHFLKIEKVPWFWKRKGPDSVHIWVRFSIQNLGLNVSRRISKMFPCGVFFSCVFDEIFFEVAQFHETSLALKNFGCAPALRHYSFWKTLHLAEVFSIIFCPNRKAAQQRINCCNIISNISQILNRFIEEKE